MTGSSCRPATRCYSAAQRIIVFARLQVGPAPGSGTRSRKPDGRSRFSPDGKRRPNVQPRASAMEVESFSADT